MTRTLLCCCLLLFPCMLIGCADTTPEEIPTEGTPPTTSTPADPGTPSTPSTVNTPVTPTPPPVVTPTPPPVENTASTPLPALPENVDGSNTTAKLFKFLTKPAADTAGSALENVPLPGSNPAFPQ